MNRGCRGTMVPKYGAPNLYTQLKYFETMFDVSRAKEKIDRINTTAQAKAHNPQVGVFILLLFPIISSSMCVHVRCRVFAGFALYY